MAVWKLNGKYMWSGKKLTWGFWGLFLCQQECNNKRQFVVTMNIAWWMKHRMTCLQIHRCICETKLKKLSSHYSCNIKLNPNFSHYGPTTNCPFSMAQLPHPVALIGFTRLPPQTNHTTYLTTINHNNSLISSKDGRFFSSLRITSGLSSRSITIISHLIQSASKSFVIKLQG